MAHPGAATIELPGRDTMPVTPMQLPRIAKYQSKSDRRYPVVRLTPR